MNKPIEFENGIQITEEQEELIHNTVELYDDRGTVIIDNPIELAVTIAESLSTDQLKQLCEAKGLSVVEWVEFLFLNCLAHPETHVYVMTNIGIGSITEFADGYAWFIKGIGFVEFSEKRVTHWCKLPQRKESDL